MRHLAIPALCCAALAGAVGCGTDPVTPPPVIQIAFDPAQSGNDQVGVVDSLLPLGLRVLVTSNSLPAAGVDVQWAAAPGNGTIGAVSTTNSDGIATGLWAMPTSSGAKTATATLDGATGSPLTFQATAVAADPASFVIQAGSNQSASVGVAFGEPLITKIEDAYGNGVEDVAVAWSLISGDAVLSDASTPTDLNGTATITVTAGAAAGAVVIRAIPNAPLASVDFALTVNP